MEERFLWYNHTMEQTDKREKRKKALKTDARRIILILVASVIMALNINTFVHTGGLYPGGATGLTVLIQRVAEMYFNIALPYTVINVILNAVPFYIGLRYVGKKFALYSLVCIMATNLLVDILPSYVVTYDTLLISIFGGLLNGVAISLCLRQNATTGGTDFIALWLANKKGMDTFNMVLGFNAVILVAAGLIFGWDKALYSIIYQFVSTQVLHVLYTRYMKSTLLIVTQEPYAVNDVIQDITNHSTTILRGEGGFEQEGQAVVYSVINANAKAKVLRAVREVDENAFVDIIRTEETEGNFYIAPHE